MKYNFKNKTVLITGGATGIGLEIASTLFKINSNIIICSRDNKKFNKAKDYIYKNNPKSSGELYFFKCNMSSEAEVIKLLECIKEKTKTVDILINNCSTWFLSPILELKISDLDNAYHNILKSAIIGTKVIGNEMKKNLRNNSIINISSFAGIMSQKDGSIYGCFKAAIIHFTKSAASELSKYNIRVNCITPGVIKTSMTSNYIKNKKEKILEPIALNSLGEGQDIANGVIFLSSNYANYISGENLSITGGKYIVQN